jgi:peroxiredoxin
MFTYFRYRTVIFAACSLGFVNLATSTLLADNENSAFADFQGYVRAADPRVVEDEFKRNHSNPPSKQEADQIVEEITSAAIAVMDKAAEFEKRFPQSKQIYEIRQSLVETLTRDFGSMGLPIPKSRAADVEACTRKLLADTPDDVQLYMILVRVASRLPIAEQRALYEELSRESTPEPARSMAKGGLRELGRLGAQLDFSFDALDGRFVRLADLKGKVVLIDFWSTTCLPCVRELPDLKKLQDKYQTQGLELIGISLDSNKQSLQRLINKEQISWPQFYDPAGMTNRLAQEFGIGSIPIVWLVDRHGVLRDLNAREDEEAKVEALLKEP